ncbi:MAG: plasmid mobilization relaxosome protein MobC [Pseudomonadota bacterium]
MRRGGDMAAEANAAFASRTQPREQTEPRGARRAISPLTLRLTQDERARLEELAAGMTLSTYVRACVFGEESKRRKRRAKDTVADKKAIAEALALLGQSRIANNLNQLAYHANIGALEIGSEEREQIDEAYAHVLALRALLVAALRSSK